MEMCGIQHLTVEAADHFFLCSNSTAHDNVMGDISHQLKIQIKYGNHDWFADNDVANAGVYGPHNMSLHTGIWTIRYSASDTSNNTAFLEKFVEVQDTTDPRIALQGPSTVLLECQNVYNEEGAIADDSLDGIVPVREYGGKRRSCMDILMEFPEAETGIFWIESDTFTSDTNPPTNRLWVLCDMETDNGGFTYYPIHNGISVSEYSLLPAKRDSCQRLGLEMSIWRSETQLDWLLRNFTSSYFKVVPGVVGNFAAIGVDLSQTSMNSQDPDTKNYYNAIDGGKWFLRKTPFSEPSGNYQTGCYLGVFGFNPARFNDDYCNYDSGSKYICSTNDKGGVGILPSRQDLIADGINYPPVSIPGLYTIVYQASDAHGNNAISQYRDIMVEDTEPPASLLNEDIDGSTDVLRELYMSEIREATGGRMYTYDCTTPEGNIVGGAGDYRFPTGHTGCSERGFEQTYCQLPNTCTNKQVLCPQYYICTGEGEDEQKELVDPGATCVDACSETTTYDANWNQEFQQFQAGGFSYVRTYSCTDESANVGTTKRTWVYIDDVSPSITIHGANPYYIEAFPNSTYTEHDASCTDKQDCECEKLGKPCNDADGVKIVYYCLVLDEIRQHTIERTNETTGVVYDEEVAELDPTVPGNYKVWFRCMDSDSLAAPDTFRNVIVQDTLCPTMHLKGPPLLIVEAGFSYTDVQDPATAWDPNCLCDISEHVSHISPRGFAQSYGGIFRGGDTVNVGKSYYTRGSCLEIVEFAKHWNYPIPDSGYYLITTQRASDQQWLRTEVYCDMITDGGGYTEYEVRGGQRTYRESDPNDCRNKGLQMLIPRSKNHFLHMIDHWTSEEIKEAREQPDMLTFVPGIYGVATGAAADMSDREMTSDNPVVANVWKAIDEGPWFLFGARASNFEPSGDYTIGCWLGLMFPKAVIGDYTKYEFEDDNCAFSDTNYLCSTNDKGGAAGKAPGPYHAVVQNGVHNEGPFPEGAERGKFVIKYHVEDMGGNRECETPARTIIVKDTMVPRIFLYKNGSLIGHNASYTPDMGIGGWNDLSRYSTKSYYNLTDLQANRAKALQSDGTAAYSTLVGEFSPFQTQLIELKRKWGFSLVVWAPAMALAVAYATGAVEVTGSPQRKGYADIADCI
jgi:hypothetical protein